MEDNFPEVKIIDEYAKKMGGYTLVPNNMRKFWARILGGNAFLVWYILKAFCQGKEEVTFPKVNQEDWAAYCGISVPTFIQSIQKLQECGLLEIIKPETKNLPYSYLLKMLPSEISDSIKKNKLLPFPDKCKFIDPIFEDSTKKIFRNHGRFSGEGTKESSVPGTKESSVPGTKESSVLIYNSNTGDSNTGDSNTERVSKDTLKDSGESNKSVQPSRKKFTRTAPERIPPKQKTDLPKKEWIVSGWKKSIVDLWNQTPEVFHHRDMTTKTMCRIAKWLGYLSAGVFFDYCKVNPDFIKRNKIPSDWVEKRKKFTMREIFLAILKYPPYFKHGYWPSDKKSLPRALDTFIYNEQTGGSFLLMLMVNGDVKSFAEENKSKDRNPRYTAYFEQYGILKRFKSEDLRKVYRGISSIENRVLKDKIFDFEEEKNPTFKQVIGEGAGKLEPLFQNYAIYLSNQNRLESDKIFVSYGHFQDFLEDLKNYYSSFEVHI